jgi:chemotaxis protein MotB
VIRPLPNPVLLEGHTDSVPVHNAYFRSNWELSAARSISLLNVMAESDGLPASRFAIAGYADNAPVAGNESESGRAQNRRVDVVILRNRQHETGN